MSSLGRLKIKSATGESFCLTQCHQICASIEDIITGSPPHPLKPKSKSLNSAEVVVKGVVGVSDALVRPDVGASEKSKICFTARVGVGVPQFTVPRRETGLEAVFAFLVATFVDRSVFYLWLPCLGMGVGGFGVVVVVAVDFVAVVVVVVAVVMVVVAMAVVFVAVVVVAVAVVEVVVAVVGVVVAVVEVVVAVVVVVVAVVVVVVAVVVVVVAVVVVVVAVVVVVVVVRIIVIAYKVFGCF